MTVDERTTHRSLLVVIEPRPVESRPPDAGPDPWAPGGSMSTGTPARQEPAPRGPGATPPRRRRPGASVVALALAGPAIVAAVVVVAAVLVGVTDGDGDSVRADPAPPAPTEPPGLEALPPFVPLTTTAVGDIEWTRIDGDARSLPERVVPIDDAILGGTDRAGRRFASTDGGRTWRTVGDADVVRTIGGTTWRPGSGDDVVRVVRSGGDEPAPVDDGLLAAPEGWRAWLDIHPAPDGVPFEAGGSAFVSATRHTQLPWAHITGEPDGGAHRVRVTIGERKITAVAGDFHEMPITPFRVRAVAPGGTYEVVDAGGAVVWTFAAAGDHAAAQAVVGTVEPVWLRWEGTRFAAVAAPWPDDHDVVVAELDRALLARSADPTQSELALWRSVDGIDWTPVALPTAPRADFPARLSSSGEGAVLTILTADGWTNWSTSDGLTFDQVPNVAGIADRSRGSFGWVAADPHGLPALRVSADGAAWSDVDLSAVLDVRGATWDTTMTATAVGSTVYVATSDGADRTLLVGTVEP